MLLESAVCTLDETPWDWSPTDVDRDLIRARNEQLDWSIQDLTPKTRSAYAVRAVSEKIYRVRCCGCGARLADAADFKEHCLTVKHGRGFAYDCEEIYEVA